MRNVRETYIVALRHESDLPSWSEAKLDATRRFGPGELVLAHVHDGDDWSEREMVVWLPRLKGAGPIVKLGDNLEDAMAEESAKGLDALIEALTILRKYANPHTPATCEHREIWIRGIATKEVSTTDIDRLETLGFDITADCGGAAVARIRRKRG